MLGATISATMLTVLEPGTSFAESWKNWWTGEAMAILLFSSFILTWFSRPVADYLHFLNQRKKLLEAFLLVVVSLALTWHLLSMDQGIMSPNKSPLLLPLLWAGLRFGPRGATAANLLLVLPTAFFTTQFSAGLTSEQVSSGEYLFNLHFSLAVASVAGLIPAIVLHSHRKTMKELHESEERFRNLTSAAIEGIFITENERVLDANDQGLKMFGYERAEMVGREVSEFVSPETRSIVMKAIQADMETAYEHQLVRKDGSFFHAEAQAKMVHVGNRNLRMTAIRDITERKHAEEQIAEQAALLDQARDAIVVRDLHGVILFWSKGAERMYGWTRKEAIGRNIVRLVYPDPKRFEEINRLFLNQDEWSGQLQHLTMDRHGLIVEARWTLVRDKEGHPKSVLEINTDITEKKRIEAHFMRAQRMESLGTLAGGIAHDLNNILAPIMMSIDILKLKVTDPQAQSILKTIEVSSKRGADIVRQVLSFARGLESERVEVQPKDLLKDIEAIIKNTFPKNIRLEISLPEKSWKILGDPTQLHQILLNLCLNARDAMPHGGSLTFSLENAVLEDQPVALHLEARAGRYVIINVIDSGTGIPPALLDKIFEPFFTTKEVGKGTGLGLSTVLAIVKSHDGFVNVCSEPDKGTTFKIYLPAMEASSEVGKEMAALPSPLLGNGETVLIVDDEASVLSVTSQTLEAFGYRTLMASNGEEAVAVYAQHQGKISVVLTDMAMPVMDGEAAIRALNKINPTIKIIVASGSASSGSVTKISDARIKHFLAKPYTAETLLKTLQATLDDSTCP